MPKKIWLFPEAAERKYATVFRRFLRDLEAETIKRLKESALHRRDDEEDDYSEEVAALFAGLAAWMMTRRQQVSTTIIIIFGDTNRFNDAQFRSVIRSTVGITLPPSQSLPRTTPELITDPATVRERFGPDADTSRVEAWVEPTRKQWQTQNNLQLEKVSRNLLTDAEAIVRAGYAKNLKPKEIIEQIKKTFEISEKRARLFVRDELGNLNAELTKQRQLSMNMTKYRWRDQRDERVRGNPNGKYAGARPSHWHRNGHVFNWNNPPEGGHPGQARLCRCVADPIIEGK